jgi:type II secretory pathway component PulF
MSVRWTEIEALNTELHAMVAAGLPMSQGLRLAADHARSRSFRSAMENAAKAAEAGKPVGEALEASGARVPALYLSLIRAGEAGGDMAGVLQTMAHFLDMRRRVTSALRAAITYPILVLTAALFVCVFVTFYLMPSFLANIEHMHLLLPRDSIIFPRPVLWAFAGQYIVTAVIAVLWIVSLGLFVLSVTSPRSRLYHNMLLHMPVYSRVFRGYLLYHFSGVLGLLTAQGVPLDVALENVRALSESELMTDAADDALRGVRNGRPLSVGLEKARWFPRTELFLMKTAEEQESLETYLADLNERTAGRISRSEYVLRNLEPNLIVFIALAVGAYAISVFLPLANMFKYINLG